MVVQACLFYIPRAIWLSVEGGLMKHLAKDNQGILVEDAEAKTSRLLADFSQHLHNKYNKWAGAWSVQCHFKNKHFKYTETKKSVFSV